MKIHSFNCGTMCPVGARWIGGRGGDRATTMVCHCLLVETEDGLALVDTGIGLDDIATPSERLGGPFVALVGPRLDVEETAARRVEQLGFSRSDVRHLVLTHLDLDHAGGIADFPHAAVHVLTTEHDAAMARVTWMERERYRKAHWAHGPKWALHEERGERWFGFGCVREVVPRTPDLLMIPLAGHTRGHAGIAVRDGRGWLVHAGDAYFSHLEMNVEHPECPAAFAAFQRLAAIDDRARVENQARLRELIAIHGVEVRLTCAHDPAELERERDTAPA